MIKRSGGLVRGTIDRQVWKHLSVLKRRDGYSSCRFLIMLWRYVEVLLTTFWKVSKEQTLRAVRVVRGTAGKVNITTTNLIGGSGTPHPAKCHVCLRLLLLAPLHHSSPIKQLILLLIVYPKHGCERTGNHISLGSVAYPRSIGGRQTEEGVQERGGCD